MTQLLVTVIRLDECNVPELQARKAIAHKGGASPSAKLYLTLAIKGDASSQRRNVPLDSLPERLTFAGLIADAGQRVNVELRSSHGGGGGNNSASGDGSELLAENSFLVDKAISKKSSLEQQPSKLFDPPLKLWREGQLVGTLQMIVEAVDAEQLALQQQQQRKRSVWTSTLSHLSRWGWIVHLASLVFLSAWKLGLFSARSSTTSTAAGKLLIGKIALRRGISLAQGDYISSCVGSSERFCSAVHLVLHRNGNLALRKGAAPDPGSFLDDDDNEEGPDALDGHGRGSQHPVPDDKTLWESGRQSRRPFQEFRATVTDSGELAILRGKKLVWRLDAKERLHPQLVENVEIL